MLKSIHHHPNQMTNFVQSKYPLAGLVSSLTAQLVTRLKDFGDRCRSYVSTEQADNPEFGRTSVVQNSPSARPAAVQRRQAGEERVQGRGKRRELDEVPLKRPRNAYNLFVASESVKIKEQNPHMRAPDIVRIAAERYNGMTPQQKRPYMQKFEEAKRLFDEQNDMGRQSGAPRRGRGGYGRGARYDYSLK